MPQPPGDQRHGERQRREQVARREPEAEHGGGRERRDEQLRGERGGAEPGDELDPACAGHRLAELVTARAPQPPRAREREREHRRPAEQPVAAVHEQRHQPVGPVEVAAGEGGAGRALAGRVGGVRGRAAVDRLVDRHVQRHREQRQLDGPHRQRPAPGAPERARCERPDHHAGRHELRAEPWQRAEQQEAGDGVPPRHALVQPEREQRGPRERGCGAQLRIHRGPVGDERRAQPDRERRAERPRIGHHPEREPVRECDRQRCDGREEQLDPPRSGQRVRGRDQKRKADAVRLVQPALGLAPVTAEVVRVEVGVRARGVLVEHVHVAVLHERLGGEQVMRLVAAVLRRAERV
ncbi:MAG: hypothetical protein QOI32_1188 [Thermoleophilaceae bacterium]|nr:hypothetical protein [Thermoleophilaceae bacterium]